MSRTSLQFHATPEDLVDIIHLLPKEKVGSIHGLLEDGQIYQAPVDWPDNASLRPFGALLVLPVGVRLAASDRIENINGRCAPLVVGIPRIANGALEEVSVSALDLTGGHSSTMSVWRRFSTRLRRTFVSGARILNPVTKQSQFYPRVYATRQAVALSKSGIRLVSPTGNVFDFSVSQEGGQVENEILP